MTKPKASKGTNEVHNTVTNCSFIAESGKASPETARAVESLAKASEKHAEALAIIAKALQGAPGVFQTGIRIGDQS